ncbi:hypothetical protein, partial [Roseovarius sp.]|uniref:hypothetical protein n=1 Tax=Roseovarius sp. TaxID=1486281 RepID=UPI003566B070
SLSRLDPLALAANDRSPPRREGDVGIDMPGPDRTLTLWSDAAPQLHQTSHSFWSKISEG